MDSGMLRIDRMRNANVAAMYRLQTGTVGILSCSAQKACVSCAQVYMYR